MLRYLPTQMPRITFMGRVNYREPWCHFHRVTPVYILYYIFSGEMYLNENGVEYVLRPGEYLLLEPGYETFGTKAARCDYYFVHFEHMDFTPSSLSPEAIRRRLQQIRQMSLEEKLEPESDYAQAECFLEKYAMVEDPAVRLRVYGLLEEAVQHTRLHTENHRCIGSCKLLESLMELSRSQADKILQQHAACTPEMAEKIQQVVQYLHSEYPNKITSQKIEIRFAVNFDYLNRVFRQVTGSTIFHYLSAVRLNHAKEFLATTTMRSSEIAGNTGIGDEYYFSKFFKKMTGLSPRQYRSRYLPEPNLSLHEK